MVWTPCVELPRDWLEAGVPQGAVPGPPGIGPPGPAALGVAAVSPAVPLPVAFLLRTILILLIVDVPHPLRRVNVDVCVSVKQEAGPLFRRTAADPVAQNTTSANSC